MHLNGKVISFVLPGVIYIYALFLNRQLLTAQPALRFYFFVGCVVLYMIFLYRGMPNLSRLDRSFLSILISTVFYRLWLFAPDLSTTPWALAWSEGSRYYYASLFLSKKIYGSNLPTSVLHPTRYLMQAAAFLIPGAPIWFHRLWQVFLWLLTTLGTGWLLARRLRGHFFPRGKFPVVAYMLWSFLFLMQGPVYYHLLVMVMLILWGIQPRHFGRSLALVLLASFWAGLSRLNWFPVPGLLAAALYLLELPPSVNEESSENSTKLLVKYLSYPALWVLSGTIAALLAEQFYILVSGNPADQFHSALTSNLLWYRLLPSPTNPIGILPVILLVSMPIGTILFYRSKPCNDNFQWIRKIGLTGILLILFVGGLAASVKIGGGADLHNLDAYLVALWILGSYSYFGSWSADTTDSDSLRLLRPPAWLALLIPVILALSVYASFGGQDRAAAKAELRTLQQIVDHAEGDVLFIDQRQLLTFGELKNLPLVPEYEGTFLMEMAMGGNQKYLQGFHSALAAHRYTYIVSHTLSVVHKGRYFSFGEENDAWVDQVSEYLLCDYEPILTLEEENMQVLAPRQQNCPVP